MKTTIKLDGQKSVVVSPCKTGKGLDFSLMVCGVHITGGVITPDQAGALIFGMEMALEVNETRTAVPA